jgi:2-polyprenyl-3-methyl-5-hydroxy-6-metoxy-1,4-benzoquinol methylase
MLTIVKFIRKIKTEGLEKIGFIPFLYDYWFRGSRVRQYIGYLRRPKIVIDSLSCQNLSKILDVGCDWGYMAKLLDLKGFSAYGLDINLGSLIFGKRILKEHWSPPILICGTGINLPFKDNSFETIISLETIEHIQLEKRKIFLYYVQSLV